MSALSLDSNGENRERFVDMTQDEREKDWKEIAESGKAEKKLAGKK